jgi:hypothetical protein
MLLHAYSRELTKAWLRGSASQAQSKSVTQGVSWRATHTLDRPVNAVTGKHKLLAALSEQCLPSECTDCGQASNHLAKGTKDR